MNIYIYGGNVFKGKIHSVLDHGNIRFKIDGGHITTVSNLEKMKSLIKEDPDQIFLIDQNKVIDDDFITKYFKFLIPKDGIKKEYLDEHGVGDISIRDYGDVIIYIEKRLEAIENAKPKPHEITSIEQMLEDDTLDALNHNKES